MLGTNNSLSSISQLHHYTDYAVLALSFLTNERKNVHVVEAKALTAAENGGGHGQNTSCSYKNSIWNQILRMFFYRNNNLQMKTTIF
jgi:hypothetical protein